MRVYKIGSMKKIFLFLSVSGLLLSLSAFADGERKLFGDHKSGSRSNAVHRIGLLNEEGDKISLDDDPLLPFSTKQTCGKCHNYETINKGWHFNAADENIPAGRPGQPWILTDAVTATQIPVSYRNWKGTYTPQQIGLTDWKFALMFGRHTPGGLGEDLEADPDFDARWIESGELEINCLACHDAESAHDQSKYPAQVSRQNFRWAAAATCAFAKASGSAKSMPRMYDYMMPGILDDPKLVPPAVSYDTSRFDDKGRVFLDVVSDIPNKRCYFCHSNIDVGDEKWSSDQDVHLEAGLSCVDCHSNGPDHNITRGYETESAHSNNPLAAVSSCRGCHLGDGNSDTPTAGRLGAPKPLHKGIPAVHFDKLTCTACHSGPWPEQNTIRTKTARAHALGAKGANLSDDALPHIIYPVFAKQHDGKIGPHKIVFPAFWGSLKDDKVTPLAAEIIAPVIRKILPDRKLLRSGDWMDLTEEQISKVLSSLKSGLTLPDIPVYISGGKIYSLDSNNKITAEVSDLAEPYKWPIAHNVRPASQSLGVRGCEDCHSAESPFYFGKVNIDSAVASAAGESMTMHQLHGADTDVYKPVSKFFKWLIIIVMALLILHITGDLFRRALKSRAD